MKNAWEKIFEYASMPIHGTMFRRLRKGVSLQINKGNGLGEYQFDQDFESGRVRNGS